MSTPTEEDYWNSVGRCQGCVGQSGAVKYYPVPNANTAPLRNNVKQQQQSPYRHLVELIEIKFLRYKILKKHMMFFSREELTPGELALSKTAHITFYEMTCLYSS